ncbi:hypothetical protein JW711_01665 [Candidatus Woesearchaeota archaeon]|nr:hypothetical protein [Candidatus Woesearchaeota archaeon]
MRVKRRIFLAAFLITAFMLLTILLLGNLMNLQRKEYVEDKMSIISDLNEIQTYTLMSDVYGNKLACLAFKKKLQEWDQTLWDLGLKLERYRVATEEFQKDPFYQEQKKKFNDNQVLYMSFLTKVNRDCELNVNIISFFYQNSEECKKCDDQSFVLTDIKRELEDEVSIFSYDMDLGLTNLDLLKEYYEIDQYPCVVINEQRFCGMQDKSFIIRKVCETNNLSVCTKYAIG